MARSHKIPFQFSKPALDTSSLISSLSVAFSHSEGVDDFRVEYLLSEMMSKHYDGTSGRDKLVHAAMQRLDQSEEMCYALNRNGLGVARGEFGDLSEESVKAYKARQASYTDIYAERILRHASERAAAILGDFSYDWINSCKLTNGASLGHKRSEAYPMAKLKGDFYVTPLCERYLNAFMSVANDKLFSQCVVRLTPGNRVTTVPKNNKTDRCIAIEPEGNILFQKGLGSWLKTRLSTVGVNLRCQKRNQRLAALNRYCTIDLSMASDTISQYIVMRLLPPDWFRLFDDLRSHYGLVNGSLVKWEKFSSMGNGFTFELETLIFHCLCYATSLVELGSYHPEDFAVYGDDIIAPVGLYKSLTHVLKTCGFALNPSKSFATGPFRESCGKHYWEGVDVTPFYIRSPVDNVSRYIWLGNSFRKWCANGSDICDPRGADIWRSISKSVPRDVKGGRDLLDQRILVSSGLARFGLVPGRRQAEPVNGFRAVACWLLQSPRDETSYREGVEYHIPGSNPDVDHLLHTIDTVYSGMTPYWLRSLVKGSAIVGHPGWEVGWDLVPLREGQGSGAAEKLSLPAWLTAPMPCSFDFELALAG